MKNKNRGTVVVSALFAVLCLAQTASAFYAPNLQRWVNRDPIEEAGGMNTYAFARNQLPNTIDILGLVLPPGGGPPSTMPPPANPPVVLPGPILGPNSKVPGDFSGVAICQRPLFEDDCYDGLMNKAGQGHKFLARFDAGKPVEGYGFYPNNKVNKERTLTCPRGKPCKPTNQPLKYGLGANKPGSSASIGEIMDCIANRPPCGKYDPPFNDCRHWPAQAASDCGLDCGQ